MGNSLHKTLLQGIMVIIVVFMKTNIQSQIMNTTIMISYRRVSKWELSIGQLNVNAGPNLHLQRAKGSKVYSQGRLPNNRTQTFRNYETCSPSNDSKFNSNLAVSVL